ncbi:hypothetical protein Lesp02_08660 [Lentzea sp. NBRC 105346]|uniref:ribonuclease domain-containing protein n=1 Tax=Lentzea sp. NBRC 105346 TaxID=3032205 RepID=UPI0024A4217B|nr:ribonuclease domain-containing protein [Lentzea sp. NBRC 105346]GLZ28676.1 hypothetical protein Lesp02_08660 [Lentzea sp. NBRC 105346]
MHTLQPHWTRRLLVALAAVASLLSVSLAVAPAAEARVYSYCGISGCSAARSADSIWESKGYPSARNWYSWPNGQCNFAGGTYYNRDGQLPSGHTYQEFDVYPRACGAPRDAKRIVVDRTTGQVYFSPNHYTDFYPMY